MRFAYAALAFSFVGSGTAILLACSDTSPASPNSTSSGTIGSSGNPNQTDDGGDNDTGVDAGITLSPDGCAIRCSPYKKAGKMETVARPDKPAAVTWTNPNAALTRDGEFATVTLNEGEETDYLFASNFDFSEVTDDKETWGIAVELARQSLDGGVEDATIEVTIAGQMPRNKVVDIPWPRVIVGTHSYGQAIDTWGIDLNPKDVRPATFGTRIAAKHSAGVIGPVLARVDSLRVAVCYCNADKK